MVTRPFMRFILIILYFSFKITGSGQISDSTWLVNQYLPKYYVDTGTYLPEMRFIDEKGQERKLTDFKGKIVYINLWTSSCGSSVLQFSYQEQLLKRLKTIHIDSLIQFVNINFEDSKKNWKNILRKQHPVGINLYCGDTTLLNKWNIKAPPAFILLDPSNKVLGKNISHPDEAVIIDYILYSATKEIHPVEALWKMSRQSKLMEQSKTAAALTDEDYKKWFGMTLQSFIEFQNWRTQQIKK